MFAERTSRRWLAAIAVVMSAACVALAAAADGADTGEYLYWPNGSFGESIARANIDGTGVNTSFITGTSTTKVAVDNQHIFWGNETSQQVRTIGRANLDGSGVNVGFITGVERVTALAVDGTYVYWSSVLHGQGGAIGRAKVDGTDIARGFIATNPAPSGLAVDGRHIYWTSPDGTIGRADLDGTNVNANFIRGGSRMYGIAIAAPYIYWANSTGIGRASIDATGVDQSFISTSLVVVGVAVHDQHLFWTTTKVSLDGMIGRANLDGTGVDQGFITGVSRPLDLAASFQPPPPNVPVASVVPTKLDFKTQPVSTLSPPLTLTVSSTGTAPLKISSVRVATGDVDEFLISRDTCTNSTLQPSSTCVIDVRFGPTRNGPRSATLTIVSSDPASPLQVALSGNGTGNGAARGRPSPRRAAG